MSNSHNKNLRQHQTLAHLLLDTKNFSYLCQLILFTDQNFLNLIYLSIISQIYKFNPSKATILAWPCLDAEYLRNNKPYDIHRGYTYRYRVQAPLCVQTSHQGPRPLKKRYPCSQVPANRPRSPCRHMGFF